VWRARRARRKVLFDQVACDLEIQGGRAAVQLGHGELSAGQAADPVVADGEQGPVPRPVQRNEVAAHVLGEPADFGGERRLDKSFLHVGVYRSTTREQLEQRGGS